MTLLIHPSPPPSIPHHLSHRTTIIKSYGQNTRENQAASESRDDYLESLSKKKAMRDSEVPNGVGDDGGGGGNLDNKNRDSAVFPELDANDDGGGRQRHAVVWGRRDAADDEEEGSYGGSSGWEDVEG